MARLECLGRRRHDKMISGAIWISLINLRDGIGIVNVNWETHAAWCGYVNKESGAVRTTGGYPTYNLSMT